MGTVEQKRQEYNKYIDMHQENTWNAWIANLELFVTFFQLDNIRSIQRAIIDHDSSKYSEEEFEPYRKNFYPVNDEEKENNKESFSMAAKHHVETNPHHWNYWVDENGIAKNMDDENIIHMLCDWMAMGVQFGNTAAEYYEKNKDKINLAPDTRVKVEALLSKLK